jgi:hypothetical protein
MTLQPGFHRIWRAARACPLVLALALAACASAPGQPSTPSLTTATPARMVEYIRATAGDGAGELNVQPLRDPEVEDLRRDAERLQAQGHHRDAAAALDHAIALVPADPALLQERAEVALLLGDTGMAGELAARAHALGSGVGPLCRRHWATLEQVRLVQGDADGAAAAKAAIETCRVAPPPRW